eukprot:TRINITY_DN39439_c0_g1_i13.p3 TRINITY_DN39439_c0_g1~~TRINITY_DN39439_c0_g1_i13.p3  ORF type:complete len:198 (-),score=-15.90 TRINITY_DN39439_c0_g1_i13:147-740(-)
MFVQSLIFSHYLSLRFESNKELYYFLDRNTYLLTTFILFQLFLCTQDCFFMPLQTQLKTKIIEKFFSIKQNTQLQYTFLVQVCSIYYNKILQNDKQIIFLDFFTFFYQRVFFTFFTILLIDAYKNILYKIQFDWLIMYIVGGLSQHDSLFVLICWVQYFLVLVIIFCILYTIYTVNIKIGRPLFPPSLLGCCHVLVA